MSARVAYVAGLSTVPALVASFTALLWVRERLEATGTHEDAPVSDDGPTLVHWGHDGADAR